MKEELTKLLADSYDQGVKDALESVMQAIKELRPAINAAWKVWAVAKIHKRGLTFW
jgi:hypothetical protein